MVVGQQEESLTVIDPNREQYSLTGDSHFDRSSLHPSQGTSIRIPRIQTHNICSKASLQSPVVALQTTYSEGGLARSWGGVGVSVMDV